MGWPSRKKSGRPVHFNLTQVLKSKKKDANLIKAKLFLYGFRAELSRRQKKCLTSSFPRFPPPDFLSGGGKRGLPVGLKVGFPVLGLSRGGRSIRFSVRGSSSSSKEEKGRRAYKPRLH